MTALTSFFRDRSMSRSTLQLWVLLVSGGHQKADCGRRQSPADAIRGDPVADLTCSALRRQGDLSGHAAIRIEQRRRRTRDCGPRRPARVRQTVLGPGVRQPPTARRPTNVLPTEWRRPIVQGHEGFQRRRVTPSSLITPSTPCSLPHPEFRLSHYLGSSGADCGLSWHELCSVAATSGAGKCRQGPSSGRHGSL
jgi:hypothetical protein